MQQEPTITDQTIEALEENKRILYIQISDDHGRRLERSVVAIDGQLADGIEVFVQDMVDTLLDETKPTF